MTATIDPTTDRLVKEIGLRTFSDRYLDRDEEQEIIRIAEQMGMDHARASETITRVCRELSLVRESELRELIRGKLVSIPGKIDRETFQRILEETGTAVRGVRTLRDRQRLIVSIMDETQRSNVKHGWFSNWYRDLKRELGLA